MPLVGIIDPSHYEKSHAKEGRIPNWLTLDEALLAAQAPRPKWSPWTFEMIQAALGEHQERGKRLSTTVLTAACPRATVLERMENYIGNIDNMYASLRGTMVHRTLESYARLGAIAEGRFYATIDGIELSGSPDLVTTDTVFDYKVPTDQTGVPSFGYPFRSQTEQLMMNAFILRHAEKWDLPSYMTKGLPFDPREEVARHVVIVYIGPKAPKIIEYQKKQELVTPAGIVKYTDQPYVWSDAEVLDGYDAADQKLGGMRARLHIMQNALDSYPDWPEPWTNPETDKTFTAEQIWGGEPGWLCPGPPICNLPSCLARTRPGNYVWDKP